MENNSLVYSSVPTHLNHKIKSWWVKHSWFYSNHENQEDIISCEGIYIYLVERRGELKLVGKRIVILQAPYKNTYIQFNPLYSQPCEI